MIAISYRREDSLPVAGRLYDRLEQRFGKKNVFMDFDSIRPGFDFRDQIKDTIERSKVVIAVIGPRWLGEQNDGSRRIDDPADFVRLEVAHALERGIPVIPLLVNNTPIPKPETLPSDIQALAYRHGLPLDSGVDFRQHADRLINSISAITDSHEHRWSKDRIVIKDRPKGIRTGKSKVPRFIAVGVATAAILFLGLYVWWYELPARPQKSAEPGKVTQQDSDIAKATTFNTTKAPVPPTERIPPRPNGYFSDYAGVISADAAARFNEQLAQFERDTSNQVVVVLYPKMESTASIDGYTRRIANAWGVGQAARQNGVSLFVFVEDKKMFMQVGEGLADVLSNGKAFDITERHIKPHFASNDFEGGIREGINEVCEATRARYKGNGKTLKETLDQAKAAPNEALPQVEQTQPTSEHVATASKPEQQTQGPSSEKTEQASPTATVSTANPPISKPQPAAAQLKIGLNFADVTKERPYENSLGMKFVPIEGTHLLFSIWDTRVSDYEEFVKKANRPWTNPSFRQTPSDPAVNVSWQDSRDFCAWLTDAEQKTGRLSTNQRYRLPTDAEWSVAVGKTKYPWGNQWPPPRGCGNYSPSLHVDDYQFTSPVGSFPPNASGLYDMGGNVWQWCEDWYRKEMNSKAALDHDAGLGKYADGKTLRLVRGGSYYVGSEIYLESTIRVGGGSSNGRNANNGFRCTLSESDQPASVTDIKQKLTPVIVNKYGVSLLLPTDVFPDAKRLNDPNVTSLNGVSWSGRTTLTFSKVRGPLKKVYGDWVSGHQVDYKALRADWFVVSGDLGYVSGVFTGFYVKGVKKGDDVITMNLQYEDDDFPFYDDETFNSIVRSFKSN